MVVLVVLFVGPTSEISDIFSGPGVSPRGCNSNHSCHSSLRICRHVATQLSLPCSKVAAKDATCSSDEIIGISDLVEGSFTGTPWNTQAKNMKHDEFLWVFRKTKPLVDIKNKRSISRWDLAKNIEKHKYYLLDPLQKPTYARIWGNLFVIRPDLLHVPKPHSAPPLVAGSGVVSAFLHRFTSVSLDTDAFDAARVGKLSIQGLEWTGEAACVSVSHRTA